MLDGTGTLLIWYEGAVPTELMGLPAVSFQNVSLTIVAPPPVAPAVAELPPAPPRPPVPPA